MTQPLPWEKNAAVPVPPAPEPVPLDAYAAPAAPEPELVPLDIYDAPAPAPKPAKPLVDIDSLNPAQREAVLTTEGPLLVLAGAGSGKTRVLTFRIAHMLGDLGVKPWQILAITFTNKAAREMKERIARQVGADRARHLWMGTFHSMFLRILHAEAGRLGFTSQFTIYDTADSKSLLRSIIKEMGLDEKTYKPGTVQARISNAKNHLVSPAGYANNKEAYEGDCAAKMPAVRDIYRRYWERCRQADAMDFDDLLFYTFLLFRDHPEVLAHYQELFRYILVDEYQDTNYIQEQIVFLLGAKHHNICVVGDDDQGLYRFRGATIRNILEFPHKFENEGCKIIPLVVNYRSNSDIVDFYNEWISTTSGHKFKFSWDRYRYQKKIEPHVKSDIQSPAVVKLFSKDDEDEWHEKILGFIKELKESGKLTDYNQLAFLFSSVKHQRVTALANFLERNGINVYSPRSDMFFKRDEIKLALGCLMLMFPKYVMKLEKQEFDFLQVEHYRYYRECIVAANEYVTRADNKELLQFIRKHGKVHAGLTGTTDYAYSGLLYKLFMFRPFSDILDTDMSVGVVDIRPTRNLALLTQIIGKFEYLHRVDVFNGSYIDRNTELLFNLYLKLLYDGGISEYEDEAEYAPSGCVSFLTIHQSKGMEFPIVLVDSLSNVPRKTYKDLMTEVEEKYFHRPAFEPYDQTKYFDFWRLYYTAFSRAQNLLVLTCDENKRSLMKTMVDRFGEDVTTLAYDMTSFRVQTEVSASPTFFGWVFGFNGKVQILAPGSVKEQYRQMIAKADENMQESE